MVWWISYECEHIARACSPSVNELYELTLQNGFVQLPYYHVYVSRVWLSGKEAAIDPHLGADVEF